MIKVYGYPKTRSLRVTWMLEEIGQDYHYQLVDMAKGESQSKEYLAVNPAGKLPAIEVDGTVIVESAAILAFLGDRYSENTLVPKAGTIERARYDQWSYFVLSELEQPLWTIGKHKFAIPKQYRVPEVLNTAAWEFQKALNILSEGLGQQEFILGDHISAVDILLAQTIRWGLSFGQKIEQQNIIGYLERMESRPARSAADQKETQALAMRVE